MPRIAIPVETDVGDQSRLFAHFGRAMYFALVDYEGDPSAAKVTVIPNTSDHFGGIGNPVEHMLNRNVNVMVVGGMGRRAIDGFEKAKIAVYQATPGMTVKEIIQAFHLDQLPPLTEGCAGHEDKHEHNHNHEHE